MRNAPKSAQGRKIMGKKNLCNVKDIDVKVLVQHGVPVVSSMQVAKRFDKQHNNVLRDIAQLRRDVTPEFYSLNFEPTVEIIEIPYTGGKREDPAYMMTRDGFSMLAMGFTGKKAAVWKEKFLQAFHDMEEALLARREDTLERKQSALEQKRELLERQLQPYMDWLKVHCRDIQATTGRLADDGVAVLSLCCFAFLWRQPKFTV
jgi:Rha family phage regulatory protein